MPTVEVIGVHPLAVTMKLIARALKRQYGGLQAFGEGADPRLLRALRHICEQLGSVVLVEAWIRDRDGRFSMSHFGQSEQATLGESDQVAYDEVYLSPDGSRVVSKDRPPTDDQDLRVAFFLHFYNPSRRILTSYGPIRAPGLSPMPDRLSSIVRYEPVD